MRPEVEVTIKGRPIVRRLTAVGKHQKIQWEREEKENLEPITILVERLTASGST